MFTSSLPSHPPLPNYFAARRSIGRSGMTRAWQLSTRKCCHLVSLAGNVERERRWRYGATLQSIEAPICPLVAISVAKRDWCRPLPAVVCSSQFTLFLPFRSVCHTPLFLLRVTLFTSIFLTIYRSFSPLSCFPSGYPRQACRWGDPGFSILNQLTVWELVFIKARIAIILLPRCFLRDTGLR